MPQNHDTGFQPAGALNLLRHVIADPAQARPPLGIPIISLDDNLSTMRSSAFRNHHDAEVFPAFDPRFQVSADLLDVVRDFRDENDVASPGDPRMESDPP